jgi:hypothetical protein
LAKKKPERAIHSGVGGPARPYRFVDVASFTEDWADLKSGDDELRAFEDDMGVTPAFHDLTEGAGSCFSML